MKLRKIATGILLATGTLSALAVSPSDAVKKSNKTSIEPVTQSQQAEYGAGLIIKYKESAQVQTQANAKSMKSISRIIGANAKHHRFNAFGSQILKFDAPKTVEQLEVMADKLSARSDIEYVEVDRYMYPLATANDTHYGVQWHYTNPTAGINLESAWDATQGQGVTVAVLDTGYTSHTDLAANLIGGYDFVSNAANARDGNGRDSNAQDEGDWVANANECYPGSRASNSSWHGTHVSGTIAAVTNNNKGVAGVAYGSKVVPIRVLAKCGGTTSDIADAIIWAAGGSVSGVPSNPNPAQVINMSLGGQGACSSTTQNAINSARSNGAVVVVASGNSNANVSGYNPGNCNGVISVAATNNQADRASYSNYGSLIDIAAPGGEGGSGGVASTMNSGTTTPASDNYAYNAGTSMAAPHVAGVAALMFAVNSNLTPNEVESKIKSSARPFPSGSSCNTSICGDGMLDAAAAVAAAQGGGSNPTPPPASGGNETISNISASTGQWKHYTLDVPAGMSNLTATISGGSGDADLYVRRGARPTTSSYDCRPYKNGNNETCNISNPAQDTYHISLRAYSTFSGVNLNVVWE